MVAAVILLLCFFFFSTRNRNEQSASSGLLRLLIVNNTHINRVRERREGATLLLQAPSCELRERVEDGGLLLEETPLQPSPPAHTDSSHSQH